MKAFWLTLAFAVALGAGTAHFCSEPEAARFQRMVERHSYR